MVDLSFWFVILGSIMVRWKQNEHRHIHIHKIRHHQQTKPNGE